MKLLAYILWQGYILFPLYDLNVGLPKNCYYSLSDPVCTWRSIKDAEDGAGRPSLQAVHFCHIFGTGETSYSDVRFSLPHHQKLHLRLIIHHSSGVGSSPAASVWGLIFCDSGHVSTCFQYRICPLCFLKAWPPRWITEWCNGCLFSVALWRALVGHSKWSLAYCCSPDTSLGN